MPSWCCTRCVKESFTEGVLRPGSGATYTHHVSALPSTTVSLQTPPLQWHNRFAALGVLQQPFDEQPERSACADFPPDWAQHIEVSCSS
jgi:hypothetical protein